MTTATTALSSDDIRARREAAGMTREALAARADCSLAWLASLERGYMPRRSPVLARVLDALDAATKNDDPALTGEAAKIGRDGPTDAG